MNLYGLILAVALPALASPALAQQFEREPPSAGAARPVPYLAGHEVDYRGVIGLPPAQGSYQDKADVRAVEADQSVARERWKSAELDSDFVYPRFEGALGEPIDRSNSPILLTLLNRSLRDVSATTFAAKEHFRRPRPFQRLALKRVCGEVKPPQPEAHPVGGSSYPSGHSAYGWAVAMILSRVVANSADALMARAQDYAESRIICGVHFPSDVEAGQVIAAAVVARLDADSDFEADLARARAEFSSHLRVEGESE